MASMSKSFNGASYSGGEGQPSTANTIGMLHLKLKFAPFTIPGADVVEFDDNGQPKPKMELHPQKRKVGGLACCYPAHWQCGNGDLPLLRRVLKAHSGGMFWQQQGASSSLHGRLDRLNPSP
jgi:hypothetical protein